MSLVVNTDKSYVKLAQLNWATHTFYVDSIKAFLETDFDINYVLSFDSKTHHDETNKWSGCTALHFAVEKKVKVRASIIKVFLEKKADFICQNSKGFTPLRFALETELVSDANDIHSTSKSLFRALLSAHTKFKNVANPCCNDGISHLHMACLADSLDVVKFFLDAGMSVNEAINFNSRIFSGYTCLHLATKSENKKMVEMLLKYGADITSLNASGLSPLHLLIIEQIKYISQPTSQAIKDKRLLNIENIIDVILQSCKDGTSLPDCINLTKLHIYCIRIQSFKPEDLKEMLTNYVDFNAPTHFDAAMYPGSTPLHFAARCNLQAVMILSRNGANLLAEDANGVTPFDICLKKCTLDDLIDILNTQEELRSIKFNDKDHLIDFIAAFRTQSSLYSYLRNRKINTAIPDTSPLWPGCTLLHIAVMCQHQYDANRIEIVLSHEPDMTIRDSKNMTALHVVYRLKKISHVTEVLRSHSTFLVNPVNNQNLSHAHIAALLDRPNITRNLLDNQCADNLNLRLQAGTYWQFSKKIDKSKLDVIIPSDSTFFHFAVAIRSNELIKYLIEKDADPYLLDAEGLTWIHRAFVSEHFAQFKSLLWSNEKLLQSNPVAPGELSHFHMACYCGNLQSVAALLSMTPNINEPITSDLMNCIKKLPSYVCLGDTPLHLAARANSAEVIDFLLKNGAKIKAENEKGLNPFHTALIMSRSEAVVNLLKSKFEKKKKWTDETGLMHLHVACALKDDVLVKALLKSGQNVNGRIKNNSPIWPGEAPLNILVKNEYPEDDSIVKILLDHIIKNMKHETSGAEKSHASPKRRKVSSLSDKSFIIEKNGLSAFHVSCMGTDPDIVESFLKFGVNINATTDYFSTLNAGYTPLHFAVEYGSESVVEMLLKYGADVNIENRDGYTPVHLAVSARLDFIKIFFRNHELNMGRKTIFNQTAIDILLENKNAFTCNSSVEYILEMLRHQAADNISFFTKLNLVDRLLQNFTGSSLESLIRAIPKLSALDNKRCSVLHHIFMADLPNNMNNNRDGLVNNIEILLKAGKLDLNQRDRNGKTPFHHAMTANNRALKIEALLLTGADINVTDNQGNTPYTYCFEERAYVDQILINMLQNHVIKIQSAGLYLHPVNKKYLMEQRNSSKKRFVINNTMNRVVDESLQVRVRDLLTEKIVMKFMSLSLSKQESILKILKSQALHHEFIEWSPIFSWQYRRILERRSLRKFVINALYNIFDQKLPELCLQSVVVHLSTAHWRILIK
ncbi:serine/threonine-protein phosphatase 6 regulatory ankyrin repeat subunit B-like [Copidosoma floridanum]|uniref:serine/threonine-protein phosphatase 6 regulatory ankyrin repeat subunit B-like n=1 Tax=Copidosoma floridanum TaxID=29053 RepID=UPI0006C94711|nr:serine/threonine-protein phosphatase 6 regulatory ankyrin repeat subunit B-like [Copidosoma floridanum]